MINNTRKSPQDCKSLDELRKEIDKIDFSIIELMGKRFEYVKEVVKYRETGKKAEFDKDRYHRVIDERGKWAENAGLNGKAIKEIYKTLIDYYINEQKTLANK
jgi:isochorismate pyruvate lyase